MQLRVGARIRSQVGPTEAVIIKAPAGDVDIRCGGHLMISAGNVPEVGLIASADTTDETLLGKRYVDAEGTVELLVTRSGPGALALGDVTLDMRQAKPLPASD